MDESLLRYINTCAKNASIKWSKNYEDKDDYIQIGLMALIIANKNWLGNGNFIFYAKRVISRLINAAAKNNKSVVAKQLDTIFYEENYDLRDLLKFDIISDDDKNFLVDILDDNLCMTKQQKYRKIQSIRKLLRD